MRPEPRRHRRVVAVLAERGATAPLRGLVAALSTTVEVRAASRALAPDAVLATSATAARRAPDGVPVAVLDGGRLRVEGAEPIELPAGPTIATSAWPPLAPLVRRRWRERLGLAPDLVVAVEEISADDRPTALAVAAAAVVGSADLPLALALGCPTVTSASTAAAIGAVAGVHVVVGGRVEAETVAVDDARAASLSRHGRALAVDALDAERAAALLLAAWGFGADLGPVARVDARLAELGTAPATPIRRRVADALALFAPAPVPAPAGGP